MSLTYAEFRKRAIRNVIKPMCFINLAICLGGTAKTCIIRKQSLSLAGFAHEALLVLVYPAIMALPALFLCWGLQEPLLVEVAVVISHIARSCALASIHWYWSTMPEVVNLIVTAKLELGMEIAISGIDQLHPGVMAVLHCLRQLAWGSLVKLSGHSTQHALVRGTLNWLVMTALSTAMHCRNQRAWKRLRSAAATAHVRSKLAHDEDAGTSSRQMEQQHPKASGSTLAHTAAGARTYLQGTLAPELSGTAGAELDSAGKPRMEHLTAQDQAISPRATTLPVACAAHAVTSASSIAQQSARHSQQFGHSMKPSSTGTQQGPVLSGAPPPGTTGLPQLELSLQRVRQLLDANTARTYSTRLRRHQVQLKIHDSSPENLKPGVLNELANKLAGAGFHMAQATVRHGCILIEVEVLQVGEAAAAAAGQGKQSAGPQSGEVADDDGLASPAGVQAVQAALQAWLATSGITAGLPAGTQLLMQVDQEVLHMVCDGAQGCEVVRPLSCDDEAGEAADGAVSLEAPSSSHLSEPFGSSTHSIIVHAGHPAPGISAPFVCTLPAAASQGRDKPKGDGPACSGACLELDVTVSGLPAGSVVCGWQPRTHAAASTTRRPCSTAAGMAASSALGCPRRSAFELVARCAGACLPVELCADPQQDPAAVAGSGDSLRLHARIRFEGPAFGPDFPGAALSLQLGHPSGQILASQPVLLLPEQHAAVAAELTPQLEALNDTPEDAASAFDLVSDLGLWLHASGTWMQQAQNSACTALANGQQQEVQSELRAVAMDLLQHSVGSGCCASAQLLMDTLVSCSSYGHEDAVQGHKLMTQADPAQAAAEDSTCSEWGDVSVSQVACVLQHSGQQAEDGSSLLHSAALSGNRAMLDHVSGWYAAAADTMRADANCSGSEWLGAAWHAVDASGSTPLHLLAVQPHGSEAVTQLRAHPLHGPHLACVWESVGGGIGEQPATAAGAAATIQASTGTGGTGGATCTTMPASCSSTTGTAPGIPQPLSRKAGAVTHQQAGKQPLPDTYQVWLQSQLGPLTVVWASLAVALQLCGLLLAAGTGPGRWAAELPPLVLRGAPVVLVALTTVRHSPYQGAASLAAAVLRASSMIGMGLGFFPTPLLMQLIVRNRLDVLWAGLATEGLCYPVCSVQLNKWLAAAVRVLLGVGYYHMYFALGVAQPMLRAAAVMGIGLVVGMGLDTWHHNLYAQCQRRVAAAAAALSSKKQD